MCPSEPAPTAATIEGGGDVTTTAKPEQVELQGDFGRLTLTIVGGPRPYLWIGDGKTCLDVIDQDVLTEGFKAVTRREPK